MQRSTATTGYNRIPTATWLGARWTRVRCLAVVYILCGSRRRVVAGVLEGAGRAPSRSSGVHGLKSERQSDNKVVVEFSAKSWWLLHFNAPEANNGQSNAALRHGMCYTDSVYFLQLDTRITTLLLLTKLLIRCTMKQSGEAEILFPKIIAR